MTSAARHSLPSSGGTWALLVLPMGSLVAIAVVVAGPAFGLLLVAGMLAVAAAAVAPGIVFAAYLLIPFYKGAVQAYSPVDITVVLAGLNAVQIIPVIFDRRPRRVSLAGIVLWVGLASLVLGGVLYAPDQGLALGHAASFWALTFLPLVPAALRVGGNPRYVRQFLWTLFGMAALTCVVGLAFVHGAERLTVFGMNTIQTALVALLGPLLGITFVLHERPMLIRAAAIVLIPAAIVVALASGSRGPLLVLLVLGVVAAIRDVSRARTVNWRYAGAIAGVALASVVIVSVATADLPTRSTNRFSLFGDFLQSGLSGDPNASAGDTSSAARVELVGVAISLFEDHPIIGVGTAGFEALSPRFLGYTEAYPHNAVLQVAAELGLVGVAVFASLVLLGLTRRLPRGSSSRALTIVFLYFLLEAMVSGDIFSDRTTWGLLLLLLLMEAPGAQQVRAAGTRAIAPRRGIGLAEARTCSANPEPAQRLVADFSRGPEMST